MKVLDLETGFIIDEKQFEESVKQLSVNYDGSEILIDHYEYRSLYDGEELKQIYTLEFFYNRAPNFMLLNSLKNGSAFSFDRVPPPDPHVDMYKWESRNVWFMQPERQ